MYIIEFLYKKFKKHKTDTISMAAIENSEDINDLPEKCEHVFLPIDSTKSVLACSKCGYIIKNQEKKVKKNFFIN